MLEINLGEEEKREEICHQDQHHRMIIAREMSERKNPLKVCYSFHVKFTEVIVKELGREHSKEAITNSIKPFKINERPAQEEKQTQQTFAYIFPIEG